MKRATILAILIVAVVVGIVCADVYLHNPLGSNNRLDEESANRNNANRLFNSQNNNRGGRNVAETRYQKTDENQAMDVASPDITYNIRPTANRQYADTFYEGSELTVAWTNQHGCGGNPTNDPHNTFCNIVIQYTCESDVAGAATLSTKLYNGYDTGNHNRPENAGAIAGATAANGDKGHHESESWHAYCRQRPRNKGLFLADQNLNGNSAIFTRQNAAGGTNGLECPEERDYYPYWTPTPWRDVAYLTSELGNINVDPCALVTANSQNNNQKFHCLPKAGGAQSDEFFKATDEPTCTTAGGDWVGFSWGLPAPECKTNQYSRDNHLGSNRDGQYQNYTWTIPSLKDVFAGTTAAANPPTMAKCALRLRYNITTGDYDPWNTFAMDPAKSPVRNNPNVNVGASIPLQLALNTAQTGRTFQDRTHVFTIRSRPSQLEGKRIVNLNMIGKRCNIVECYPAVEYLWMPNHPVLASTDALHIQWSGVSNTHKNGADGGDGQTGDSGQGDTGTDRHNFVVTLKENTNFPLPLDKFDDTLFDKSSCFRVGGTADFNPLARNDCAVTLATAGHFTSTALTDTHSGAWGTQMNQSPPSLIGGVVLIDIQKGEYPFICSRDNNFTNRDQKGVITVP